MKDLEILKQLLDGNHLNEKEQDRAKELVKTLNNWVKDEGEPLTELTQQLELEPTDTAYFEYIEESHINGNFTQVNDLFNAMEARDKEDFITRLKINGNASLLGKLLQWHV